MKCYYILFTKDGILTNYGCYMLIFITITFAILSIFFYKCGYLSLEDNIKEIIETKEEEYKNRNKNINIKEAIDNNNIGKVCSRTPVANDTIKFMTLIASAPRFPSR